ncbi:cellulose biosynthesis protein BcsC [Novosphingobium decolorationis]|uniref:BCSC C-terminal domain-containing protein n=1 Tax=Novosphingobium decolorationis TaxID=2698673 RepID=A0ABX8E3C2_9SPHN|nr:cellulose biosynthesis protein BcsC [Novosphingobium decolorationis]QVM83459.1 BCSC C-terminal domain-containing protein [Novosphingobium decolorationis]
MIEPRVPFPTRSRALRTAALAALLGGCAMGSVLPVAALAQDDGVAALIEQAKYWRSKGREDLAQQALRRARAIDPDNPAIAAASRAAPAPAPQAEKPSRQSQSAARTSAPGPARSAAPARRAAPARPSAADRAGRARVAGFEALEGERLETAATEFEKALAINSRDPDALGGLGIVRLRQQRFAEAADLLERASRAGKASQWAEGLASARYFAGVADAQDLLDRGQLGAAQARAEELVRSNYSEPAPALEILAQVYEQQGRYADAADLYRQAAEGANADENRLQMRAARGRALAAAERGDDTGAVQEFQAGLMADPEDPWIRYEFAQYMIKRGRMPEAESLLRALVSIGAPDALYAAALLNEDLGRPAEAERLLSMIPETQRTAPMRTFAIGVKTDAAIARARALSQNGQREQALGSLRQLGEMRAIPVGKQAAIASALFDLGDQAGAAEVAQRALNGEVTDLGEYEGLIGVLVQTGRDDLAQTALQRAGQMAGSSPQGQQAYGRMQATLMIGQADRARLAGSYAEAFDILQSAYSSAPDNVEILAGLARLYENGNMAPRAAQTWQLYLAKKPGDKDGLIGLAQSAQRAGDGRLSDEAADALLRSYPQDYQVYMALADVERVAGNERKAVRYLKQARELYARQHNATSVVALGGNPFAGMQGQAGANPFRNQGPAMAQPQPVNPFALGGGTRLPAPSYAPQAQPMGGYGASAGYAAANESYTGQGYGAQGYAAQASSAPSYDAGPDYSQGRAAPAYASRSASAPAAFAGSATATQSAAGYGAGAAPAPAYAPAGAPQRAGASIPTRYGGDPVLARIQSEIAELAQDTGPRGEVQTAYRRRSGETGLSQLDEIKGSAELSTGLAGGRVYAKAEASVIDAGRPTGSGLARFGANGVIEAAAIVAEQPSPLVNADSQHASGVAFSAGYTNDFAQVEVGTTPIGMGETKVTYRAAATPKIGRDVRASAWVERKPVTDSVVSYAGTRDPVTGVRWGQVMRFGAGGGLSYDRNGNGVYGEGRYYRFTGTNVAKNSGFEANAGGYLRAYQGRTDSVTVGLNVNYQGYDKSQNYFTFGNGGYFSPQSFISVGFPVNYAIEDERFVGRASFTPGFQSYSQDRSLLYPTEPLLQGLLDGLKLENDDVRSYYDGISETGFALSAEGELYYKLSNSTRIGGEASYNTFGSYDEFRGMLGVRQSFGSTK